MRNLDLAAAAAAFVVCISLLPSVYTQTTIPSNGLPIGSCTATIPCANGACCNGKSGFCGFGPSFCGSGNCTSNCNAKAECGQYAPPENKTCPLNVCCSQYGFCGQTSDFCATGCQSNCNPSPPVGGGDDYGGNGVNHRRIGYYEGWAISSKNRLCDSYPPEQIAAEALTHVNFAFALISSSFELIEMAPGDKDLWSRTTALKKRNSQLEVWLSVGGWTFNDPPTQHIFSNLVGSDSNTQTFIKSALSVMKAYGFSGLDIDWEYPAAYDRGGAPADKDNYVKFMQTLKKAFGTSYGVSFTAPSSYWYLQHFDIPKLADAVDFINIMTYDLHGTWDGVDPWIGKVVLAHTNLTEIKTTLQLFQNVFTSAKQWQKVNVGFGFYGRSFQLASAECSHPGCPFSGPADAGPCTNNPGTLSFAEIGDIINKNQLTPILDEEAAVKYIVWNENQWVSYDDAESFKLKVDYLKTIVGGSMVWSIDQDDAQYTALNALYPDADYNNASSTQNNQCKTTGCGESCPDGWNLMASLTTPDNGPACPTKKRASLCCPKAATPQNCKWEGGGGKSTTCDGQCGVGQITLALDVAGNPKWKTCHKGTQAFCCDSGTSDSLDCYATSCGGQTKNAPAGYAFMTTVKQGSQDNGGCESSCAPSSDGGGSPFSPPPCKKKTCPEVCSTNDKPVLCADSSSYTDCHWVGTVPTCTDAACPVGYISVFQDIQGDAKKTCSSKRKRNFCCKPPKSESFLPVPESWVIPVGEGYDWPEEPASFTADFDDNIGPSDPESQGVGSSNLSDDGLENDSPFGEVFVTSPNSQSVSSLDTHSDWVIVGCDAKSDQPQSVLAYCSLELDHEESGCSHVLIGGAQHTIVRMPKTCGTGPYSRIHSFEEADDETILPDEHAAALPTGGKVYRVKFDYSFDAIPESNGPVYMRADITDLPGYWDEMINSKPDSSPTTRRELIHMKRNFHNPPDARWFGGFSQWLKKINTLTSKNSISRNFHWSDKYTIYHAEESCPNFQSSLDISVTGVAQASSEFGYYLEATVVPPAIQQAYVYMNAGASARATFTATGIAKAEWQSLPYELISFGFPGLSYPGLLTLGPSLHIYAGLSGEISLTGKLSTTVGYTFPEVNYAFGSTNDDPTWGPKVGPTSNNNGYDYNFGYNVELKGGVSAHITPSLELGLSVLGGKVMDAQVYLQADLSVGVGLNGSVSQTQAPEVCIQPSFGVNLHAGLKGSVIYWGQSEIDYTFYQENFDFGGKCFNSASFGKRELGQNYTDSAASGSRSSINHDPTRIVYSRWEKKEDPIAREAVVSVVDVHEPVQAPKARRDTPSLVSKRGSIPYLPGNLFCPAESSNLNQTDANGADCLCYSDASISENGQDDDVVAKRDTFLAPDETPSLGHAFDAALGFDALFDNGTHTMLGHPVIFETAKLRICNDVQVTIPSYSATNIIAYYDHEDPGALDPTVGSYISLPVDLGGKLTTQSGGAVYAREHVYEQSMSSLFIDYLSTQTDLWQNAAGNADFCDWVKANINAVPSWNQGQTKLTTSLGLCYPGKTKGLTPNMVVLEQTINVKKNIAFQSGERRFLPTMDAVSIASDTSFGGYCSQKQVAVLRAAAGIPSYLNDWPVQQEFLKANTCIRNIWAQWYTAYAAATGLDAPKRGNVNVPNLYDNWVHGIMANVKPFLQTEIRNLISQYNDYVTNANGKRQHGSPPIDISFYYLMDQQQLNKKGTPIQTGATAYTSQRPTSMQDLTDNILNNIADVYLADLLPTH